MTITIDRARRGGPQPSADPAAPTLLLLHGAGAHEDDLVEIPAMTGLPLGWASLRAPFEVAGGGASWFRARRPQAPDPAELAASTRAIWSWVDDELGSRTSVVPVGFSQGAFMVTQLLLTRPDRVVAPVMLSGLMLGDAPPVGEEAAIGRAPRVRPPLFWGRGSADPVISADEVEHLRSYLTLHTAFEEHVYPGLAHGISRQEIADLADFIRTTLD